MNCWRAWADHAAAVGPKEFYSDSMFCDYPPGYIYVLSLLGYLRTVFPVMPATLQTVIFKMPAIIFDCLTGYFLYKTAKRMSNEKAATSLFLLYILNPAIFVNSAIWGQVDALFTFALLSSLVCLSEKKYRKSACILAIAVLLKPQALLTLPIYILAVFLDKAEKQRFFLLVKAAGSFLLTFVLLSLPFIITKPPTFLFTKYMNTLQSYPYASLNAFNLFTFLGLNAREITENIFGLSYGVWGTIGMLLSIFISCYIFMRGKDKSKVFFCSALLISGSFMLCTKMHERYLYPAIPLFFFAFLYNCDKRIFAISISFSVLHFLNVLYVYLQSAIGTYYVLPPDRVAYLISLIGIFTYCYAIYVGLSLYVGLPSPNGDIDCKESRIVRKDVLIMSIVTLIYAMLSFVNLGDTAAPQTTANYGAADLGTVKNVDSISVYKGIGDCRISFETSEDSLVWSAPIIFEGSDCFKWTNYSVNVPAQYIRITVLGDENCVYEVACWDSNKNRLSVMSKDALFDEQSLAAYDNTYLNSTYFDEIYHARTAYEHMHYMQHYETTHPPLGKLIISIGIRIFGMNPFGWRIMGNLFGILMLPLMYLFGKKLFKSTFWATTAMLFLCLDCMHFAQTRIATIDTFAVFFILLSYYFMYLFYEEAEVLPRPLALLYLALSGTAFGFAIASKWIGFYAGAGLCVLFFAALFQRVRKNNMKELLICGFCILFFVAIPFIIYYISYIPIHIADGADSYWHNFWSYQKHMFQYHAFLQEGHPFSSPWYSWPFMARPIWYYGNNSLSVIGKASSIVCMGNPLLWWASFVAVMYCIIFKFADRRGFFVSIGYLSQYLPWIFISRACFIYHYFASLPFAFIALVYCLKQLLENHPYSRRIVILFLIIAGALFLLFYPVIAGMVVPQTYTSSLEWFPGWTLGY
ncbi:MAG: glycosyltransferase family 39 protein [Clostridia bacterium]|nr:glycosyltransferase family 39 protein [Clostridia bacterium]